LSGPHPGNRNIFYRIDSLAGFSGHYGKAEFVLVAHFTFSFCNKIEAGVLTAFLRAPGFLEANIRVYPPASCMGACCLAID
jgi:hypothetical protein